MREILQGVFFFFISMVGRSSFFFYDTHFTIIIKFLGIKIVFFEIILCKKHHGYFNYYSKARFLYVFTNNILFQTSDHNHPRRWVVP